MKNSYDYTALVIILVLALAGLFGFAYYQNYSQEKRDREEEASNIVKNAWKKADEADSKRKLDDCLKAAEDKYWSGVELNASKAEIQPDGSTKYVMTTNQWDKAAEYKKEDINNCYRRYD